MRSGISRPSILRSGAWLLVLLCLWPWGGAPRSSEALPERLIGPAAGLAASFGWMRFDWLVREGRYEAAYAAAERALELDPTSPQGWIHYAMHLTNFRGAAENELDPAARCTWIQAGLDLLARGEQRSAQPGELALAAGLVLYVVAALEDDPRTALGWPGGAPAARRDSEAARARAHALGVHSVDATPIGHDH